MPQGTRNPSLTMSWRENSSLLSASENNISSKSLNIFDEGGKNQYYFASIWYYSDSRQTCLSNVKVQIPNPPELVTWTAQFSKKIYQVVTSRLPNAPARVRSSGICGEQSGIVAGFLRVLLFLLQILILSTANIHHLSSGAGTIGQLVADVPSALSLTPPQGEKKHTHTNFHSYLVLFNYRVDGVFSLQSFRKDAKWFAALRPLPLENQTRNNFAPTWMWWNWRISCFLSGISSVTRLC
jgi:hypothetical protein